MDDANPMEMSEASGDVGEDDHALRGCDRLRQQRVRASEPLPATRDTRARKASAAKY